MKTRMHTRTFKVYMLTALPRQQWLRERASLLRYTYLSSDAICDSEPVGARCHCYRDASEHSVRIRLLFWFTLVTCTKHGGLWKSPADCPEWLVETVIFFLRSQLSFSCSGCSEFVCTHKYELATIWSLQWSGPSFLARRKVKCVFISLQSVYTHECTCNHRIPAYCNCLPLMCPAEVLRPIANITQLIIPAP